MFCLFSISVGHRESSSRKTHPFSPPFSYIFAKNNVAYVLLLDPIYFWSVNSPQTILSKNKKSIFNSFVVTKSYKILIIVKMELVSNIFLFHIIMSVLTINTTDLFNFHKIGENNNGIVQPHIQFPINLFRKSYLF